MKQTKGYFGRRKNVWTVSKNAYEKGLQYAYRDRRKKKGNFRSLWIQRINAAVREHGMSYSEFMGKLSKSGIEINRITDVALKSTKVRPGLQIVERLYGLLEVHSESQAETRAAGAAILEALELQEEDRRKPRVVSSQIIRKIDAHQVQLINRMRHGHMLLAGQTLYVLEVEPAGYAALAWRYLLFHRVTKVNLFALKNKL